MPLGVMSKPCTCCRKWEKKKHWCSHQFCLKPCRKQDEMFTGSDKKLMASQQYAIDYSKHEVNTDGMGLAPIVIPVYPAGMPQGGVKRQRGRPKKVRPEDANENIDGLHTTKDVDMADERQQSDQKDNSEIKANDVDREEQEDASQPVEETTKLEGQNTVEETAS